MMLEPNLVSAIAAIFSAVAACAAAFATWLGPIRAARLAEDLRRQQDSLLEQKKQKYQVFLRLMETRAIRVDRDSVAAFNLIDLVFIDSNSVRDAWAELYSLYNRFDSVPGYQVQEKLLSLLRAMANDIGLSNDLRAADFERIYYPKALVDEDQARAAQQQAAIAQLSQTATSGRDSLFPPPPQRS